MKKSNKVFDTNYYKKRYSSFICKLPKDESVLLNDLLKRNNIGFTEFVRIAIYNLEEYTLKRKYVVEKRVAK